VKLVIATANAGKAKEFREMLGAERFEWSDLSSHREIPVAEETGKTFRANACLKASYYAKKLDSWALADDSGLVVDALDGAPGVLSARWAEANNTGKGDADNNATLLKQLADVPDEKRTARFVCVLALADRDGRIVLTTQDSVEGTIIHVPRGTNGFGYDPLFFFTQFNKTTAELSPEQKHAISHRGKALRRMKTLLEENLRMLGS
jgi:XTP/dITP diphosphohydrolase